MQLVRTCALNGGAFCCCAYVLYCTACTSRWGQRIGWDYTRTVGSLLEDVWPILIQRYTSVIYSGDVRQLPVATHPSC